MTNFRTLCLNQLSVVIYGTVLCVSCAKSSSFAGKTTVKAQSRSSESAPDTENLPGSPTPATQAGRDPQNTPVAEGEKPCLEQPVIGKVEPEQMWHWKGLDAYAITYSSPVAGDIDGNGSVEVVIIPSTTAYHKAAAPVVVLDAATGTKIWDSLAANIMALASTTPALIDLDNDGKAEIVGVGFVPGSVTDKQIFAIDFQEKKLRFATPIGDSCDAFCSVAVGDLNQDGKPEVVAGNAVLNFDGSRRSTLAETSHFIPSIADLVPEKPGLEIIADGAIVMDSQGGLLWKGQCAGSRSTSAVADMDKNGSQELVCVGQGKVFQYNATGKLNWEAPIPTDRQTSGNGGAPNIGDFNGDGKFEIGTAGGAFYAVYNHMGDLLWKAKTQDWSSSSTGSTIFDFNGDGKVEVVYNDEVALRIYDGSTGQVLWETANPSGTLWEYPLVLNIDSTPSVEIVVSSPDMGGVRAFRDPSKTWVNSRNLWNQYSYYPSIVSDTLGVNATNGLPATGFRVNSQGKTQTVCVGH